MTTFTFAESGVHTPVLLSAHAAYSASRTLVNAGVDQVVPFVVQRPDTPVQHDITALFPGYAAADAFATALRSEGLCTALIADVLRRNLVLDPLATSAGSWVGTFGTGGLGNETMVTGAVDGPLLPDGTRPTTYARYTWTTGNTSGSPVGGYSVIDPPPTPGPFAVGLAFGAALYARPSVAVASAFPYVSQQVAGGDGANVNLASVALLANVWTRVGGVGAFTVEAQTVNGMGVVLANKNMPTSGTLDVVAAMVDPGTSQLLDYFDGDHSPRTMFDTEWEGPPNNSTSVLVPKGVQVEQFTGISSSQVRVQNTPGIGATEVQFTLTEVPA